MLAAFIYLPFIAALLCFAIPNARAAKAISLLTALCITSLVLYVLTASGSTDALRFERPWLGSINSQFALLFDGVSKVTVLLTAVSFLLIFLGTWQQPYAQEARYQALMLLTMSGLMGVFLSADALLFYFFWELALIPVYFLCSRWGGERRIQVTFKFFIYTFLGSVVMLVGIIYLYNQTADHSFAWESFKAVVLSKKEQTYFFWFFLLAFAVKMPLFPFHTWQPDTYETSPGSTTMVLSAVMAKMGLFAVIRWLLPVFPKMADTMGGFVIVLSIAGILYASLIAIRQDSIKRLIAYSSIAHIGLMNAALFVNSETAYQGALIQIFNHGINIIGLWLVVDTIEKQTGIRRLSELGGLASQAPGLALMLVVVSLANIALPLTNAFVGEFMMFSGLFNKDPWYAVVAGIGIILAAVYTLRMIQWVLYGENRPGLVVKDLNANQWLTFGLIAGLILAAGIYPKPLLQLGAAVAESYLGTSLR